MRARGRLRAAAAAERFTWADRRRLAGALVTAREARLYRRLEAVLLIADGKTAREAARIVRATRVSVQRWLARYLCARDPGALADRPRRGRPRVAVGLTPGRVAAVLARDPRTLGYRATTWTVPLLAHHLREREGFALSDRTVRRRLRERRYRWKRPRHVYHERATHVAQKKGG
jgi:transposase